MMNRSSATFYAKRAIPYAAMLAALSVLLMFAFSCREPQHEPAEFPFEESRPDRRL